MKSELVHAIAKELILQKGYVKKEAIKTIYFGGGTPSLLSKAELQQLLQTIHNHFDVVKNPEVTFEANPDDLSHEMLYTLAEVGINRLSIGVQSFDNEVLTFLNRAHTASQAFDCITNARRAGISNLSIDLIYAIPERSDELWAQDLDQALSFNPNHISSYCLTVEPDTVFGRRHKKGTLDLVSDDRAADQFDILQKTLQKDGFEQYEVSNFCKPGFESNHNSAYWKQETYLGVGPSAHSYNKINRQYNVSHNKKYIDSLAQDKIPFTMDHLSNKDRINDYLLTTLRTKWGSDLTLLKAANDYDLKNEQFDYIDKLIHENKAFIKDECLILTPEGLLMADQISSDLFVL